ncbi:MAG: HAD family hydrolase [Pseudomonadota bacterium]
MDLIVFDLDGTLLDASSSISPFTAETLALLRERDIAYTVATGRTLHDARLVLDDVEFNLPHVYKNGVMIWQPETLQYSHANLLSMEEIRCVLEGFISRSVTPFIFTIEPKDRHGVYHLPLKTEYEHRLKEHFSRIDGLHVSPVSELPGDADITNISALGPLGPISAVQQLVEEEAHLVAYSGTALEGQALQWIDIQHSDASKGNAVQAIRDELGVERVICFGDSDNDLSMFELAEECYAPSNAKAAVKAAATATIGHHDDDGIAIFLDERYSL